jgi:hypothetical protein
MMAMTLIVAFVMQHNMRYVMCTTLYDHIILRVVSLSHNVQQFSNSASLALPLLVNLTFYLGSIQDMSTAHECTRVHR